jgi:pyridoxamine 5'-phosphate oxidase
MDEDAQHIAQIRADYSLASLDEEDAGMDPVSFFKHWLAMAIDSKVDEVNAMTLATADQNGHPHARTVLLKGIENGKFVFFTNYNSNKGKQIADNQHVALLFFWKELQRQVRIEGIVEKIDETDSISYFKERPIGSQIGAMASPQSQIISSRKVLEDNVMRLEEAYQSDPNAVQKPLHWGGYAVTPVLIEFWQGRSSRLHDRIVFEKKDASNVWKRYRIAP